MSRLHYDAPYYDYRIIINQVKYVFGCAEPDEMSTSVMTMMGRRRDILTQFVGYKKAVLNGAAATRLKGAGAFLGSFKTKAGVYNKEKNKGVPPEGSAGVSKLLMTCVTLTALVMEIYIAISIDDRSERATKPTYCCQDQ
jgi:hypothetical protein